MTSRHTKWASELLNDVAATVSVVSIDVPKLSSDTVQRQVRLPDRVTLCAWDKVVNAHGKTLTTTLSSVFEDHGVDLDPHPVPPYRMRSLSAGAEPRGAAAGAVGGVAPRGAAGEAAGQLGQPPGWHRPAADQEHQRRQLRQGAAAGERHTVAGHSSHCRCHSTSCNLRSTSVPRDIARDACLQSSVLDWPYNKQCSIQTIELSHDEQCSITNRQAAI